MKKINKIVLTVTIVLAILGVVLCGVGVCLGIENEVYAEVFENGGSIKRIVAAIENIVEEENGGYNGFSWGPAGEWLESAETKNWTFNTSEIKDLSVKISAGDIKYKYTNASDIKVTAKYANRKITVEKKGKELVVQDKGKDLTGKASGCEFTIEIPGSFVWGDMSMHSSAGDICFEDELRVENEIELTASAGDIKAGNIYADTADIKISAGDLKQVGSLEGEINIKTSAGDIEIKNADVKGNLYIKSSAGNTAIELAGREKDYNYDIKNSLGELNISGMDVSNGINSKYKKDNGSVNTITVKSSAGDTDITFNK